MSAVVGCEACGVFKQVPMESIGTRCTCGGQRSLVLTVEQNQERWRRGISLEEWFAAPRAPATRAACEARARPCPSVRCRHHLGTPGQHGCDLDFDGEPQTLAQIGRVLGVTSRGRAHKLVVTSKAAFGRAAAGVTYTDEEGIDRVLRLPDVPEDEELAS